MQYISIFIVISSSIVYHLSQKLISTHSNPLVSLLITYLTALMATLVLLLVFPIDKKDLVLEVKSLNWSSYVLGIAIVALEFGFLYVYRSGWNISIAAIVSNVTVAMLLVPIGLILFKEKIELTTLSGIAFCFIGLYLINRK